MKKLFSILVAVLFTSSAFLPQQANAQAPEKMSYQAVIRTSNDKLVINTQVGIKLSIRKLAYMGFPTIVYVETQTPTTNQNGLISIEIGGGTKVTGNFTTIDWGVGEYDILAECDPDGGTIYTINGASQLLSVPYALHAKNGITNAEKTKLSGLNNADGSETKVNAGTNVTVTGIGTTASPYKINATGTAIILILAAMGLFYMFLLANA